MSLKNGLKLSSWYGVQFNIGHMTGWKYRFTHKSVNNSQREYANSTIHAIIVDSEATCISYG
ncbi:MAG: hypothetical protein L0H53_12025 [Candidatus Nitrosocosmicus sp.]|nr:hypothetical protein [Candidatus Nitrosocosmicus sp.]